MEGIAAVLETPDAAIVDGDSTPALELEESPQEIPDQSDFDAPESDDPDDTDDPYDGMSPQEIAAKVREEAIAEARAEAEAGKAEALRRQRESIDNEQRRQAALAAATNTIRADQEKASAQALTAAEERLVKALEGDVELDRDGVRETLRNIGQGMSLAAFDSAASAKAVTLQDMGLSDLDGDFKARYWQARAARDFVGAEKAFVEFIRHKQHEASIAWFQAQQTTAAAQKEQDAAEVEKVRAPRKAASGAVQPTVGRGAGVRVSSDAERLKQAQPGTPEHNALFRKVYGIDSPI